MDEDRRTFLRLALATVATRFVSGCSDGAGSASAQGFGDVPAGNVSALSVGTVKALTNAPAFMARDAKGLYAMTTTCTHAGCDLASQGRISAGQIACGCHGSVFDANGDVVSGPARGALVHFSVSVDAGGEITVHGGETVAADVRVTLP
jgi:Rieske Fe-S protein